MANGKIIRTAQSGLNPEIIAVKIRKIEAIELREAKKPLVVEMRPVIASVREAIPIIGARKTDSMLPLQEKKARRAFLMFSRNVPQLKSFIKKSEVIVDGYLISS